MVPAWYHTMQSMQRAEQRHEKEPVLTKGLHLKVHVVEPPRRNRAWLGHRCTLRRLDVRACRLHLQDADTSKVLRRIELCRRLCWRRHRRNVHGVQVCCRGARAQPSGLLRRNHPRVANHARDVRPLRGVPFERAQQEVAGVERELHEHRG